MRGGIFCSLICLSFPSNFTSQRGGLSATWMKRHEICFFSNHLPKTRRCYRRSLHYFLPRWCTLTRTALQLCVVLNLIRFPASRLTWLTHCWACGDDSHPCWVGCKNFLIHPPPPPPPVSPSFRLWESSYHPLPGLSFGCRERVILGSLTRDASGSIGLFSLPMTVENPISPTSVLIHNSGPISLYTSEQRLRLKAMLEAESLSS